jgi:hypothetical protein
MKFTSDYFVYVVFLLFIGYFFIRIIKYKGFRGALFGGEITKTFGEIELSRPGLLKTKLKIHRIKADGKNDVGVEVISKSALSYRVYPVNLSREEASRLAELITRAANEA